MPRLSRAQEHARQQIAQLASSGLSPNRLGERILAAIELAVSSDGAQLYAVDPTTLLFNRLLGVSAGLRSHIYWYLRNLYLNEPLSALTHPNLMRVGLTAIVLHDRPETSWGLPACVASQLSGPEFYRTYHEVTGVAGGILRAFFPADGQWVATLDLARFDAHDPFRPTDVEFLRLVAPTIGRLLRAALDREHALRSGTMSTPDACGVLVLAANGHLQLSTPAAESWVNLLQDAGESREDYLPSAIWSVIAGLRAGKPRPGQARVVASTPEGQIRIEASPMGDEGAIAVVLTPCVQLAAPAIPPTWNLTRQEWRVVEQVLRGLSNQQIARSLVISEDTVESHLKHVYAKLNVHSRGQLIAQYFAQAYIPNLFQ